MKKRRSLSLFAISVVILVFTGCTPGEGDGTPAAVEGSVPGASAATSPAVSPPATASVPGQARLIRGSESVRGVAGFGRNAIPALYGEYALPSTSGEMQLVSVWFTRVTLVLDEGWSPRTCPGLPAGIALAQSGQAGDGLLVLVASAADYRMVFRLSPGFGNPCRFISVFLERFTFFMRNASREEDLSFPAFLQL